MQVFFSRFFLLFGFLCLFLAGYLFWQRNNPYRLSFDLEEKNQIAVQTATESASLNQITIPDLKIDLAIYPAVRKEKGWDSTTKGVSYLTSSPLPGEIGNSILYGHNWRNLLGSLTRAKPGQKIQIIFDDGTQKTFIIDTTTIVTPDQTSVLNQTKDRRITIYTCTGFLDRKRFVAVAILSD